LHGNSLSQKAAHLKAKTLAQMVVYLDIGF